MYIVHVHLVFIVSLNNTHAYIFMAILVQIVCLIFGLGLTFSWSLPFVLERQSPITYVHTTIEEGSSLPSSVFDDINRIMTSMHQRFERMFNWPTYPMDYYYDSDYQFQGDYDDNKLEPINDSFDTDKQIEKNLIQNDDSLDTNNKQSEQILIQNDDLLDTDKQLEKNLLQNDDKLDAEKQLQTILIQNNDSLNTEKQLQTILVQNDDKLDIQKQLEAIEPICTTVSDTPTTISPRKNRRKKLPVTQTTTCVKEFIHNGQKHFSEEITTTDDKNVVIKHSKSYGSISLDIKQHQQQ